MNNYFLKTGLRTLLASFLLVFLISCKQEILTEEESSILDAFEESYAESTPADQDTHGVGHDVTEIISSDDDGGFMTQQDEDGNHYFLKNVSGKIIKERLDFPWDRGYLVAVGYTGDNLGGDKTYFWSNKRDYHVARYKFGPKIYRKMESIAFKNHCSLILYEGEDFEDSKYRWMDEYKGQRWSNSPSKSSRSMSVRCQETTDASAIVYEHSNYGGKSIPIWDRKIETPAVIFGYHPVFKLPSPMRNKTSSIRINTHDFQNTGIQMGTDEEASIMMAFKSVTNLPDDINDLIYRFVVARGAARSCNPRSTCWTGPKCDGSIITTMRANEPNSGGVDTPQRCAKATKNRGISKNKSSWCSRNGRCWNPRIAIGIP